MKYKRIILILSIFILFSIASVSASEVDEKAMMSDGNLEIESTSIEHDLKTTKDSQVLSKANDNEIQILKDNGIAGNDIDSNTNATFEDLRSEIEQGGGNITLKHKFYNYNGAGQGPEFININVPNSIIDGNGAVIDMKGSFTQVFHINNENITVKNLTIKNACRDTWGLGFYITGNDARILDCNFIDNNGQWKGLIYFDDVNGAVTNCTFINNIADTYSWGGAVFNTNGNVIVTNCYFSGNYAQEGSDIYSESNPVTADTCIFKDTGTTYNVQIVPPTLNVDDFITLNNSGEKLTFDLKTHSNMSVDNGNISISVYDKNDSLIGEYSCLSGEGWSVDLPVGSYYAIFNTEYAGFEAINRTITVIPNIEYYINVTPVTTSNKTVNITAKSNIPTDIIGGRLVFILPNGDEINGTYDSNSTWMTVHTFDKYGTYEINATYTNFKIMTVNSANITVRKTNSTIYLDDIVLDYHESELITVATEGAKSITAKIDENPVKVVDNFTISISDLDAGNYTLTVTTVPDETHITVTKTVNLTINKLPTKIIANDMELKSGDKTKLVYILLPENAKGQIYFKSDNPYVVSITSDGNLTAASTGTANITITFTGNKNYEKTTKTINIKVDKTDSTLIIPTQELTYKPSLNLTVYTEGTTGITAKINGKDAKVNGYTIEIPEDAGKYTLTVTTIPGETHNPVTKTVNLTINKAPTEINANDMELTPGDKTKLNYLLVPKYAEGNITFENSNPNVVSINSDGAITAVSTGTAKITITFTGNKNYEKTTKTINIKVEKANSTLSIGSSALDYGNSINITADTTGAKGITAKINDQDVKVDGFTIEIPVLDAGKYTLTVTTIPDKNHNPVTKTAKITVNKAPTEIAANDLELIFGDKSELVYVLAPENAEGNITFASSNPDVVSVNSNGEITAASTGTAKITITFTGNKNYEKTTKTINIKVNKAQSILNIESSALDYGNSINITADTTGAKGITAKINDQDVKVDGFTIEIPVLDAGKYTLTVTTVPDENYISVTKTANITVRKINSTLTVNDITFDYKSKGTTTATFTGSTGITAEVINQPKAIVNVDGTKITVSNLNVGTYTLSVTTIPDDNHNPVTKTAKITVNKLDTELNATYDAKSKNILATVKDNDGNPISGLKVGFAIDGGKNITTDANGQAKYSTANLPDGTYNVNVQAYGNETYKDSNKQTVKFTIENKKQTKIFLRNALYFVTQTKIVQVTLWDENNQPLANKTVCIRAYDSIWKGITDENGNAYIRVGIGFGVHNATVSFEGDDQYNASNRSGYIRVIKETPSVMVRGADSQFKASDNNKIIKVHLRNRDDKPLPEGSKIVFKLNGKTYVGTTDNNGVASIKININKVGTFNAQAMYAGNSAYNAVTRDIKIKIV